MPSELRKSSADRIRSLSFGSVASEYERHRPGYPAELVDAVEQYAGRPLRCALEVGAGTGKATRVFASRGIAVTALEPDAEMAHVLEQMTRELPVKPVVTTLEEFTTGRCFDLMYAAAAWHWTDPTSRWQRAVDLLAPAGVLALFGRPSEIIDPALSAAVADIEKRMLPDDDPGAVHPWSVEDMASTAALVDIEQRDLPCVRTTTAAEFVARLATVSAYLMLSPPARADALRQVRAVLPDRFDLDATVQLSLARRV